MERVLAHKVYARQVERLVAARASGDLEHLRVGRVRKGLDLLLFRDSFGPVRVDERAILWKMRRKSM